MICVLCILCIDSSDPANYSQLHQAEVRVICVCVCILCIDSADPANYSQLHQAEVRAARLRYIYAYACIHAYICTRARRAPDRAVPSASIRARARARARSLSTLASTRAC